MVHTFNRIPVYHYAISYSPVHGPTMQWNTRVWLETVTEFMSLLRAQD